MNWLIHQHYIRKDFEQCKVATLSNSASVSVGGDNFTRYAINIIKVITYTVSCVIVSQVLIRDILVETDDQCEYALYVHGE